MDNLNCAVARDLLPLYVEGLTAEDTDALIAAHLASCGDCAKLYAQGADGLPLSRQPRQKSDRKILRAMRLKFLWYLFWPMLYALSWQFGWQQTVLSLLFLAITAIFIPCIYAGFDINFDNDKRRDYYNRTSSPFAVALYAAIPLIVPAIFGIIPFVLSVIYGG